MPRAKFANVYPSVALCVLAAVPAALGAPIADYNADWDTAIAAGSPGGTTPQQGEQNWEFGYFPTDGNVGSFTQLGEFGGDRPNTWNPSAAQNGGSNITSPIVAQGFMHPGFEGSLTNKWSAVRWTNEEAGQLRIFGTVTDGDAGNAGGARLRFYVNGAEVQPDTSTTVNARATGQETSGEEGPTSVNFNFTTAGSIPAGQLLVFALDDLANSGNDSTTFDVSIEVVPEPGVLGVLSLAGLPLLRRRRA